MTQAHPALGQHSSTHCQRRCSEPLVGPRERWLGQQSLPPPTMSICFSSVVDDNPRRIPTVDCVVGCVVHQVVTVKDNEAFNRSACHSAHDAIVQLKEPWNSDAGWRPRHIHIIEPSSGGECSQRYSWSSPPSGEGCWST